MEDMITTDSLFKEEEQADPVPELSIAPEDGETWETTQKRILRTLGKNPDLAIRNVLVDFLFLIKNKHINLLHVSKYLVEHENLNPEDPEFQDRFETTDALEKAIASYGIEYWEGRPDEREVLIETATIGAANELCQIVNGLRDAILHQQEEEDSEGEENQDGDE